MSPISLIIVCVALSSTIGAIVYPIVGLIWARVARGHDDPQVAAELRRTALSLIARPRRWR